MGRLRVILSAIWSKFLGKQEMKHHREILDLSYEQMVDSLTEARRNLASVASAKHGILRSIEKSDAEAEKLDADAGRFLAAGDEQSARETLARKQILLQSRASLQAKADGVAADQLELEANIKELDTRIQGYKTQKEVIKADYAAAEANAKIGQIVTGITKDSANAMKAVGRIEERTEAMKAEGDAIQELIATGALEDAFNPGQSPLDRKALAMARDEGVEADLERLRKQLNGGAPTEALPAAGKES